MYEERPSRLSGAVLWRLSAASGAAVLPDGCMDLLWTPGRLLVAGPDTRPHRPDTPQGVRYAGVRFAPGTAPALLGAPARELRDRRVPLADLWGAAKARELTERVDAAADPAAALESLALRRAAAAPRSPDPLLAEVVRRLEAGGGVSATADALGVTARTLHRRSLDAFGYAPKTLARILRLQRALALVRKGAPFADAALASGCADQAHLAREVRELAGTTLSAYASAAGAGRRIHRPSGTGASGAPSAISAASGAASSRGANRSAPR